MANTAEKIPRNTFFCCCSWCVYCPCNSLQPEAQIPSPAGAALASYSCLCTAYSNLHTPSFKILCLTLFILLLELFFFSGVCVLLLLLPSHPHCSPTACRAGTAIPCKERREEKHSLILLCTVSCMTFDHRQRLSHSWIGPKGRNNSRKTTLLVGSEASRTPQSLLPHLQFVADLAKGGIQLLPLWFK